MQIAVGSGQQLTAVVVDTGSGSFYDAAYNASASATAVDRKIEAYLG